MEQQNQKNTGPPIYDISQGGHYGASAAVSTGLCASLCIFGPLKLGVLCAAVKSIRDKRIWFYLNFESSIGRASHQNIRLTCLYSYPLKATFLIRNCTQDFGQMYVCLAALLLESSLLTFP